MMDNLLPPQNIEAEQAVLGAIFFENAALKTLDLKPEDFYKGAHQKIYQCMCDMNEIKDPIDLVTLTEKIQNRLQLEEVGGAAYISELATLMPTTANIKYYAKIVTDKAIRRKFIFTAGKIMESAYRDVEVDEIKAIFKEEFKVQKSRIVSAQEVSQSAIQYVDRITQTGLAGISTGFKDLDPRLRGYVPSNIYVLASRPGHGKTAFALNSCVNMALLGTKVGIFELEMSDEQLGIRAIADIGEVEHDAIARKDNYKKFLDVAAELSLLPIHFCFSSFMDLNILRNHIDEMVIDKGVEIIWIDYLQLISNVVKNRSREVEISEISRMLKACAKEYQIPIIELAQVNRECEKRINKRPILSDLRESGSLEQDADAVIMLYRDEVYDNKTKDKGIAELIVSKNRHGRTGSLKLQWDDSKTKFRDLASSSDSKWAQGSSNLYT